MKHVFICLWSCMFVSCIPYAIAPKLEENHVSVAKKFQKNLPRTHAYIFEDPKKANEFFDFIDYRFRPDPDYFSSNIPISINGATYYLSFYEVERTTKTFNIIPVIIDKILEDQGMDHSLENLYESRNGTWYFALTVTDAQVEDALSPEYRQRKDVVDYLHHLKEEYLSTQNYKSLLLSTK